MTVRLLTFNEIFFRLNLICRFRLIECRIVRMKKKKGKRNGKGKEKEKKGNQRK